MEHTTRKAKLVVWALVLATLIIAGIASAQEDIGIRAVIFVVSLIPAGPAILLGSWVNDMKAGASGER